MLYPSARNLIQLPEVRVLLGRSSPPALHVVKIQTSIVVLGGVLEVWRDKRGAGLARVVVSSPRAAVTKVAFIWTCYQCKTRICKGVYETYHFGNIKII
jgi:hypothetical protein